MAYNLHCFNLFIQNQEYEIDHAYQLDQEKEPNCAVFLDPKPFETYFSECCYDKTRIDKKHCNCFSQRDYIYEIVFFRVLLQREISRNLRAHYHIYWHFAALFSI